MSWPITRTLPESGRIKPVAIFINSVFPVPVSPSNTFVSPGCTSKETEFRTSRSSKPMEMLRKEISGAPGTIFSIIGWRGGEKVPSARATSARLRDEIGGGRSLVIRWIIDANGSPSRRRKLCQDRSGRRLENVEEQLGDEGVHNQDEHRGDHDRSGRGAANALRSAFHTQPLVTADRCDNQAEDKGLGQALYDIADFQRLDRARPDRDRAQTQREVSTDETAAEADEVRNDGEQWKHEHGRDDARRNQLADRICAERAHRVHLLGDDH